MGRGTWYYSLGVFLAIVDAFVRSESWSLRRIFWGGAIDGCEAEWNYCVQVGIRTVRSKRSRVTVEDDHESLKEEKKYVKFSNNVKQGAREAI
ncbi:hypothetical protein Tco_1378198 [Tanacetum coccineum]